VNRNTSLSQSDFINYDISLFTENNNLSDVFVMFFAVRGGQTASGGVGDARRKTRCKLRWFLLDLFIITS